MKNIMRGISALLFLLLVSFPASAGSQVTVDDNMRVGMPFGADAEGADLDLCPQGVRVVGEFLSAWRRGDYETMYELIDDKSKNDYPFEQAKIDFRILPYREYRISSIRKKGKDFEFILSYGEWQDGDKELKKLYINGSTFKIIMASKSSPFKESITSYF